MQVCLPIYLEAAAADGGEATAVVGVPGAGQEGASCFRFRLPQLLRWQQTSRSRTVPGTLLEERTAPFPRRGQQLQLLQRPPGATLMLGPTPESRLRPNDQSWRASCAGARRRPALLPAFASAIVRFVAQ